MKQAGTAPKESLSLVLLLGALTAFGSLSIDMYLPAFPAIGRELQASAEAVQQTLALFFLGMAGGQLFYGPLSDRFGRRKPLLVGLALYVAASLGCACAHSVHALIVWRLLQGLGGCAGIVIARAVVRDRFDPVHAARIFSELMMVMGVAPILAPFIGGQLLLISTWRTLFWLLALFGAVCFAATLLLLRESWSPDPAANAFSPRTVARNFTLVLEDPTFRFPALTNAFAVAAMFTYIIGSPGVFIGHFGVAPNHYGFFFGANAFGLIAASQINRRLLTRFAPQAILRIAIPSSTVAGITVAAVGWSGLGGLWGLAAALFLFLSCLGFMGANLAACALSNQGRHAGSASALMGTLQFAAASLSGAASSHALAFAAIGTPLHGMCLFIALCIVLAAAMHLAGRKIVAPSDIA